MGVCTFLVSDDKKEWFDLGKTFFDEIAIDCIKEQDVDLEGELSAWLQDDEFNQPFSEAEADKTASVIAAWMREHPDWRFLTDQDDEFDDVYLAEDDEDAKDYRKEFGEDGPIYRKTGTVGDAELTENGTLQGAQEVLDALQKNTPHLQWQDAASYNMMYQVPKFWPLDIAHLLFDVDLAPGQVAEVRPSKAFRLRALGDGRYEQAEEVPLDSIKPFRVQRIGPTSNFDAWQPFSDIWFTKVRLGEDERSDLVDEVRAYAFLREGTYSISPSAAHVRFVVENRSSEELVRLSGCIEGITPAKEQS